MRTNFHNRQSRRAELCIRAHTPCGFEPAIAPSAAGAPAGDSDGLAQVAERIAQELELSPEAIEELLYGSTAAETAGG